MAHQKVCDNCHNDFESRRSDARFCLPSCKAEYHRNGGPRPHPSVNVRIRTPHDEATFDGFEVLTEQDGHQYIRIPLSLYNLIMRQISEGVSPEKKSDFVGATLPAPRITIDPATVKVTEVDESKRREISINNAMAALDDF